MTHRAARRRAAWGALVVLPALLAAGCSGSEDAGSAGPSSASSPAPTSSVPDVTSTPSSTDSAAATQPGAPGDSPVANTPTDDPSAAVPPNPGPPAQALATREFSVTGTFSNTPVKIRFDLVELRRRGELLDLTATVTNLERDRSRDLRWQVGGRFDGPYRKDLTGAEGSAFSGVVLTDITQKKRYLVAADSGNSCVCTVQLSSIFIGAGQSAELSATYAAPPATTTTLDVSVTSLGTFRDLPVS